MVVDDFVHGGLGEAGLIELVVTETAVAVDIDDSVLLELLAVLDGDLGAVDDSLGVISVDVQHDGSAGLGDLRGVRRRSGVLGHGGETDLVVDDDVDRSSRRKVLKRRKLERLSHDSLASKGGISVDQHAFDIIQNNKQNR